MPDREYKIRIVTVAESAGAQEAKSSIEEVTKATGKSAEANEEHHKSFVHAGSGAHELHRLLHGVSEESQAAGIGIRTFINPMSGMLTLGTLIFARMQEGLKALEESLKSDSWESYATLVDSAAKSLDSAKIGAASFASELHHIATEAQTASEQSERLSKVHIAQASAAEKVAEAQEKLEMAKAATIQDPVERAEKELEIENRFAAAKNRRAEAEERFARAEASRRVANEELSGMRLQGQLDVARGKALSMGSEETVDERIRIEQDRLKTQRDEDARKRERLEALEKKTLDPTDVEFYERRGLREQLEQGSSIEEDQKRYVERLKSNRAQQIAAIKEANDAVKELEGELKGTITRIHKLKLEAGPEEQIRRIGAQERAAVTGIDEQSRTFKAATSGGAAVAASKFLSGDHMAEVDYKMLEVMLKFVGADRTNAMEIISLLANHTTDIAQLTAEVRALKAKTPATRLLPGSG